LLLGLLLTSCRSWTTHEKFRTTDDEIIVAGQRVHTSTRVITWKDPGGYNGYLITPQVSSPKPKSPLPEAEPSHIRDHVRDLSTLRKTVDQLVLHYDACGVSKVCFQALRSRGLSVHFLLDVDGTIYQTLDVQERALHATTSNDRSIGVEIANIGAFSPDTAQPLDEWYHRESGGDVVLTIPSKIKNPRIATPRFRGRPIRPEPVRGCVQDKELVQYDFTAEQYAALAKLTAALCGVLPELRCDYPHARDGEPIQHRLSEAELVNYRGILGHYHVQENKVDPGPAFQWKRFITEVREELERMK
jgi:N-acetyl-anhydromuramyl-L-alanine amidase AmpD